MILMILYKLTTTLQIIENGGSSVSLQGKRNRTKLLLQESSVKSISLISEHRMGALDLAPNQQDQDVGRTMEGSKGFHG